MLLDSDFLINAKRTTLHDHFSKIFEKLVISDVIHYEVVEKGLEYGKRDALLTKKQIQEGHITVYPVPKEQLQTIENLIHEGEASLLYLHEQLSKENHQLLIASDDRVFTRYATYVYPHLYNTHIDMFSSLSVVVYLRKKNVITNEVAYQIVKQLERYSAHRPLEIMETFHRLEELTEGDPP